MSGLAALPTMRARLRCRAGARRARCTAHDGVVAQRARRRTRGISLLEALIALAILSFALLGLTRLQTNLVRQATDSQFRLTALQLIDELLSTALVDTGNADCYTLPAAGSCSSANASQRAADWHSRALASLPGSPTAVSTLNGGRLTVRLTWTGRTADDARAMEVSTDVRP